MIYRHIIYQNFQKKNPNNMNIFLASNKIYKNSDKAKSAIAAIKPHKNYFKNTKII